ncbi:MAG: IS1634 family transposase [Endomicrobium sp.]|nr:IS1634 family transposase [Endomicrobium sp.]
MKRYICKEKFKDGRVRIKVVDKDGRRRIGVKHIGVAHNEKEIDTLLILAREEMRDPNQLELKLFDDKEGVEQRIIQKRAYSKYLFESLGEIYDGLKFNEIKDETFKQMTIARIIEPASKLDTIRILKKLGLEVATNTGIHRSLRRAIEKDYRRIISNRCCERTTINKKTLLLYDVTTLYFEIDREDEYRKSGYSKERRLEPQIIIGLLVDKNGFPLALYSFEGNKAETKTIIPVLNEFKKEHKIDDITVIADAGMLSAQNLDLIEEKGFKFVVGSRIAKMPYGIENNCKKDGMKLKDGETFEENQEFKREGKDIKTARRVIYQYKQKRADLDNRNIDKQIRKSEQQLKNNAQIKRAKFLKIVKSKKEIDYKAIREARLKAGIKGYVTNLSCEAQQVIDGYHNLFQVERSFRMSKTDLCARPIFHQKRDSIEAHLTICFAALAICRYIQDKTKISIKRFVQRLELLQTGIIKIGNNEYIAEPEIDFDTQQMINLLKF